MTLAGFPDALQFARVARGITDIKARSEQLRVEIVTGRAADANQAFGAQVGEAHLLSKAIGDNEAATQNIQRALSRAGIVQLAVNQLRQSGEGIGTNILGAVGLSDEPGIRIGGERARGALEESVSLFNQRFEGRTLFSGDAVDRAALASADTLISDVEAIISAAPDAATAQSDLDFYFNDPAGGFASSIYIGGAGDAPQTQTGDGSLVDYTVRADDPTIRDLLRGYAEIAVTAAAPPSAIRNELLSVASTRLVDASNAVAQTSARIGVAEERLQRSLDGLSLEASALTEAFNEKTAIDPFEAASELQQLESQLQASFVLTSRISGLTLTNFLR